MFEVQKYLRSNGTIESLKTDLGIEATFHESLPLVILNYSQINSPKTHPIVRECRALTLEIGTWNIVGRSFKRFFNWGEVLDEAGTFNWENCFAYHKEDGSLMPCYNYRGDWHVNTRSTFGNLACGFSGKTWSELFFEAMPKEKLEAHGVHGATLVFEYCSTYNRVVREYPKPQPFLLTMFSHNDYEEFPSDYVDQMAKDLGCPRPAKIQFRSAEEVVSYLENNIHDATFEGFVLCDDKNNRWKIKSKSYVALHRLKGNNPDFRNPKILFPVVMAGEEDEVTTCLPELKPFINEMKVTMDQAYAELEILWNSVKDIANQKDFAQSINQKTKFTSVLFKARKLNISLHEAWRASEDLIYKVLFT